MKVSYNVKGDRRKELVKALEEILGVKSEYMGVHTFAYHIGTIIVDREGAVIEEVDSTEAFENIVRLLSSRGFEAENENVLIDQAAVKMNPTVLNQGGAEVESSNELVFLEIQMPTEMFTPRALENLKKLVHAKGDLIKKAIGVDELLIKIERETIGFPWFPLKGDADEVAHHEKFIEALCPMAINQKRVTAKPVKSENEKYDFRCFLLRLSFIGDEHKAFRRYYLRNLSGNVAFKRVEL